ncbi:hypothetical protein RRG08_020591 [Elysia crispata]|uniref:Uncharacterized protein n=1 Tax=Elysia crispata TaxID=231223 RepID=A0AAE1A6D0_9GAST|nr:hypothetical protein RRG08_020591 [Elysia crispata]
MLRHKQKTVCPPTTFQKLLYLKSLQGQQLIPVLKVFSASSHPHRNLFAQLLAAMSQGLREITKFFTVHIVSLSNLMDWIRIGSKLGRGIRKMMG